MWTLELRVGECVLEIPHPYSFFSAQDLSTRLFVAVDVFDEEEEEEENENEEEEEEM